MFFRLPTLCHVSRTNQQFDIYAYRAPVLVATALIELGMKYEDAVDLIRKKRRGAINAKQLEFLSKYKRRKYFIKVRINSQHLKKIIQTYVSGEEQVPDTVESSILRAKL